MAYKCEGYVREGCKYAKISLFDRFLELIDDFE